jgi:hypothetical protein
MVQGIIMVEEIVIAAGRSNTISTSKIRKITAMRKKRIEKGVRGDDLGSNPHSNGDLFSRSMIVFFDNNDASSITMVVIIIVIRPAVKIVYIIYFILYEFFNWKSNVLVYTK